MTPPRVSSSLLIAALLGVAVFGQDPPAEPPAGVPPAAPQEQPPAAPGETTDRRLLQEETRRAETVIVTATRDRNRPFNLPYRGVGKAGVEVSDSRVIQDALKEEVGVVIQRTSYGQSSPFIRNLTGYHTLLLVNGIRLNNSIWRSGPNEYWGLVDGTSLEQLELVMGPASVLYGSDAAGGTVNALPLRRLSYGESDFDVRFLFRYSTAEDSVTGRAQLSGNVDDVFGFVVGGSAASFDDLHAGGDVNRQKGTGYSQQFTDGSFDFHLSDQWTLGILTQTAWLNGVGRQHRTPDGVPYHGTQIGTERKHDLDFERHLDALFLEGRELDSWLDSATVRLSFQRLEEDLERVRSNNAREKQGFDVETLGIGIELVSSTAIGRLTYGVDFYHDDVESFRKNYNAAGNLTSTSIQGPVGDEADYDLLGVYLQDDVELGEKIELLIGGRFTYAAAGADKVQDPANASNTIKVDDDWTSAVGSGRLLWKPSDDLRFFGGVSQAFRAPNLSDLSRFDIALANELEIPAPDVDPEHFLTFEIGSKAEFGGFRAEAAYFYTIVDDLVIRQPTAMMSGTNTIVVKSNDGDGHLQGIELRAGHDFDGNWSIDGHFAWTDGQLDGYPTAATNKRRDVFPRLAPIQGSLGLRWQTDDGAFYVRPSALFVDRQDRLSSQDLRDTQRIPPNGSPGYTIWNFEAGYWFDERKRVVLSFENLGDKNYRVHGSGTQEPGFNVILAADVTF